MYFLRVSWAKNEKIETMYEEIFIEESGEFNKLESGDTKSSSENSDEIDYREGKQKKLM